MSGLTQFQAQANPSDWQSAIDAANSNGIPPNIFLALVAKESSWNPAAQSGSSTSYGYTQLTAGTAADLGVNQYDTKQNLQGGASYLAQMYAKFGNWTDALAHYNQGPGATGNALAAGKTYAGDVMALAGSSGGATAPADSSEPDWMDKLLAWVKSQLGNVFFLLIGGALIVIAVLSTESGQTVAKAAVVA